jgi:hypothetical protein
MLDGGGASILRTFVSVSKSLSATKRRRSVSASHNITPSAKTSLRPSSGRPRAGSGLM